MAALSADLRKMTLRAPLRVLVACDNDPQDPRSYSGTLASVLRLLDALRDGQLEALLLWRDPCVHTHVHTRVASSER